MCQIHCSVLNRGRVYEDQDVLWHRFQRRSQSSLSNDTMDMTAGYSAVASDFTKCSWDTSFIKGTQLHGELCQSSHTVKDFIHRKIDCFLEMNVNWATDKFILPCSWYTNASVFECLHLDCKGKNVSNTLGNFQLPLTLFYLKLILIHLWCSIKKLKAMICIHL